MTIAEHLALIRQGVEAWNEWRNNNPGTPNLSQANLSQIALEIINLKWADLTQANLSQANLKEANLRWANLSQANLSQAILNRASLRWANLNQVNLSQANLVNADLRGVNLSLANLSRADLSDADLSGQDRNGVILTGADLKDANLNRVNLNLANLNRADLSRANLSEADLSSADLTKAILTGVDLRGAILTSTNLRDTDLRRANLIGVDLSNTDLSGADLREANLIRANLNDANLSGANLSGANLLRTQALGTNFTQAILIGASLEDWQIDDNTNFNGVIWDDESNPIAPASVPALSETFDNSLAALASLDGAAADPSQTHLSTLETVDLVFSDGIDWRALLLALEDVQVRHKRHTLIVQAIENQPDGSVVIRLNPIPDIELTEFKHLVRERYEAQLDELGISYRKELQATDEEIAVYRQQSTNLFEIVKLQATTLTRAEGPPTPAIAESTEEQDLSSLGAVPPSSSAPKSSNNRSNSELRRAILGGLDAYEAPMVERSRTVDDAFEAPKIYDDASE